MHLLELSRIQLFASFFLERNISLYWTGHDFFCVCKQNNIFFVYFFVVFKGIFSFCASILYVINVKRFKVQDSKFMRRSFTLSIQKNRNNLREREREKSSSPDQAKRTNNRLIESASSKEKKREKRAKINMNRASRKIKEMQRNWTLDCVHQVWARVNAADI